ncbi:MAG: hypothetical protein D6718_12815 [Acidobacteria bacterium]|nr:MAG: hypothetical protein D6718_12815 [Acidobacteriota bacterium]
MNGTVTTERHGEAGYSVPELIAALLIATLLLGLGYSTLQRSSWRSSAAVAELAGRLELARSRAVFERNDYVVVFDPSDETMKIVDDEDGDGSYTPGRGERIDRYPLSNGGRAMVFGFAPGTIGLDGQPITRAISFPGTPPRLVFDPAGKADSGVMYLIPEEDIGRGDPTHMRAITVSGATARIRRWRYDPTAPGPGPWRLEP